MTQDPNPHEALASIQAAREGVAPPTDHPFGYDLIYGALCALLLAGPGMPQPWSTITPFIALIGFGVIVVWWRKKFGWWVSGYSPKRARWVSFGLVAVFMGLISLSIYGKSGGPDWLFFVSGGLGFVAAIVGGRLWMRVWRKELADGVK